MILAASAVRLVQQRLARVFEYRRRLKEREAYGDARAHQRAMDLLLAHLTEAQRAEFARARAFVVRSASGQRYRINYGTTSNIEVLAPDGEVEHRLCAGPVGVPTPSVLLAQKLMLETHEAEFLRIAVMHPSASFHC
jgi:hypothetical protein